MRQPGMDKTGPVPMHPATESMPVEQLIQVQRQGQQAPTPSTPQQPQPYQNQPMNPQPGQGQAAPPVKQEPGGAK